MRYECYYDYGRYGKGDPKLRTDFLEDAVRWLDERYDHLYRRFREYTEYSPYEVEYCERNAWSGAAAARIFDTYKSKVLDLRWTKKYPAEM